MDFERLQKYGGDMEHLDASRFNFLAGKVGQFMNGIKAGDRVLIAAHPDTDGLAAASLVKNFLERKFGNEASPGGDGIKNGVKIDFTFYELADNRFFERASGGYNHVISVDEWIDNEPERQDGIRRLLADGVNILCMDHHDKDAKDISTDFYESDPKTYDPLIPETMSYTAEGRTAGNFVYVSPKRLGARKDSSAFTASMIAYRILSSLDESTKTNAQVVPLSIYGDIADRFWPELVIIMGGVSNQVMELARNINLSESLKKPEKVIERLSRLQETDASYDTLKAAPEIKTLSALRDWTESRVRRILEKADGTRGYIYYHVTQTDSENAKKSDGEDLRDHPVLYKGISDSMSRNLPPNKKAIVVVTQTIFREGRPYAIKVDFKYDGEREIDMRDYAAHFLGGGHIKASGAMVYITDMEDPEAEATTLHAIQAKLAEIFQPVVS
jgi:hypothetical protein